MSWQEINDTRLAHSQLSGECRLRSDSLANFCTPNGDLDETSFLAYPVCCQYDKSVIIYRSGLPRLSNNASRFSAGFSR